MGLLLLKILIVTHLVLAGIYTTLIFTRRSTLTPANILPIVYIPFFGIISAIAADLVFLFKKPEDVTDPIEALSLGEDIYWKSLVLILSETFPCHLTI